MVNFIHSVMSSMTGSQELSLSNSSLSPTRQTSSHISKVYKQASQLFLTRRLSEALAIVDPVVSPPANANGYGEYDDDSYRKAPIATASTSHRIKIWSLYITLLNAILDLTDDEGGREIGQRRFKDVGAEVRNGEIWEKVVRDGYGGREGSVDGEVVYNLSVILTSIAVLSDNC